MTATAILPQLIFSDAIPSLYPLPMSLPPLTWKITPAFSLVSLHPL